MTMDELGNARRVLDGKISDFRGATGPHHSIPSRWRNGGEPVRRSMPKHLGLLREMQRLHAVCLTLARGGEHE